MKLVVQNSAEWSMDVPHLKRVCKLHWQPIAQGAVLYCEMSRSATYLPRISPRRQQNLTLMPLFCAKKDVFLTKVLSLSFAVSFIFSHLFFFIFIFFVWSLFLEASSIRRSRQLWVIGSQGAACHTTQQSGCSWPRVKHTLNERPPRKTRRIKGFFHNGRYVL